MKHHKREKGQFNSSRQCFLLSKNRSICCHDSSDSGVGTLEGGACISSTDLVVDGSLIFVLNNSFTWKCLIACFAKFMFFFNLPKQCFSKQNPTRVEGELLLDAVLTVRHMGHILLYDIVGH